MANTLLVTVHRDTYHLVEELKKYMPCIKINKLLVKLLDVDSKYESVNLKPSPKNKITINQKEIHDKILYNFYEFIKELEFILITLEMDS